MTKTSYTIANLKRSQIIPSSQLESNHKCHTSFWGEFAGSDRFYSNAMLCFLVGHRTYTLSRDSWLTELMESVWKKYKNKTQAVINCNCPLILQHVIIARRSEGACVLNLQDVKEAERLDFLYSTKVDIIWAGKHRFDLV